MNRAAAHRVPISESIFLSQRRQIFVRARQIHFVRNHEPRTLRQQWVVQIDFLTQLLQIFDRIAAFASGNIDNEKKNPAARNVAEKFVPESEGWEGYPAQVYDLIAAFAEIEDRYAGDVLTDILREPANGESNGAQRVQGQRAGSAE